MKDNVNHPIHYTQGGIECIDALASATINLTGIEAICTANAIKYLWRWKQKNGIEDLKKAVWYINRLVDYQLKQQVHIEARVPAGNERLHHTEKYEVKKVAKTD